jgi:hypothetical protein
MELTYDRTWPELDQAAPEPYPAPEITSRDQVSGPVKSAVSDLVRYAEALGWSVVVTYARGHLPHATTGRPGACRDSLAVRMQRAGHYAVAVYREGSTWSWDSMWILGNGVRQCATITALKEALT